MIFSIVENVNEHEKVQKLLVKGGSEEIATELENILKELLKRKFPVELLYEITFNAVNSVREN